jgi:XTP/dITP diphosphohydrolase
VGFPAELALASLNPGKIREVMEICADWPVTWHFGRSPAHPERVSTAWPEVEETGKTYLDNATLKARAVSGWLGVPALGEDSGIEVDALGGAPGPRSARFAGPDASDEENLRVLIDRLRGVPAEHRTARYRAVAVCAWPDGRMVHTEGVCEGGLILEPRGTGGFGYDPVFEPEGERRTMAELSPQEKNAISHRGKALRAMRALLAES